MKYKENDVGCQIIRHKGKKNTVEKECLGIGVRGGPPVVGATPTGYSVFAGAIRRALGPTSQSYKTRSPDIPLSLKSSLRGEPKVEKPAGSNQNQAVSA
jgi:hypothetical protein